MNPTGNTTVAHTSTYSRDRASHMAALRSFAA